MAELKAIATQIRRDIVRMVHAVNSGHPGGSLGRRLLTHVSDVMVHGCQSGHPGGSLGCADFLTALYFKVMKHNPSFNMDGTNEDIFFLSNGHISPLFYSTLARSGYFDIKELATFRKINSRLQGHPATHEHLPGIRIASGSLGQGMSVAIGAALSKKLNGQGKPIGIMMHTVMGKGVEFMEGTHEWHGIAPNDEQLAKALAQLPETLGDY